jgi:hypothetical protein
MLYVSLQTGSIRIRLNYSKIFEFRIRIEPELYPGPYLHSDGAVAEAESRQQTPYRTGWPVPGVGSRLRPL